MNAVAPRSDYRMRALRNGAQEHRMRILILAAAALVVLVGLALLADGVSPECGQVVVYGPKHRGCIGPL
jgi:hypothetical protein